MSKGFAPAGFRDKPLPPKRQRERAVSAELENLQTAVQISQMMLKQLMQSQRNMMEDLGRSFNLISELQYKVLAAQEVAGLDVNLLQQKADVLRLKDFNEASDKQDAEEKFTVGAVVDNDSTVIITSTTADNKGIFRSRLKLAETGVPALIQGLMGKEVGAKVEVQLNDALHTVELLAIRQPPQAPVDQAPEASPTDVAGNA
jgi:hypothetical protein